MSNMEDKKNYELIDCGDLRRLERFGDITIDRPAPVAKWEKKLDIPWQNADIRYINDDDNGNWKFETNISDKINLTIDDINMILKFSKNGQIGLFPEQQTNWRWLNIILNKSKRPLKILNTFAYTGALTLFCALNKEIDHQTTHLEGSSSIIGWAKENAQSNTDYENNIRWINDDVLTFMEKEIRRGNDYNGIILDPPAFGRSGKKTWKLERDISKLFQLTGDLLKKDPAFLIFSCHSQELTIDDIQSMFNHLAFINKGKLERIELTIPSEKGNALPSGICVRWKKDAL